MQSTYHIEVAATEGEGYMPEGRTVVTDRAGAEQIARGIAEQGIAGGLRRVRIDIYNDERVLIGKGEARRTQTAEDLRDALGFGTLA